MLKKLLNVFLIIAGIILIVEIFVLAFVKVTLIQPQLGYTIAEVKIRDLWIAYVKGLFSRGPKSAWDEMMSALGNLLTVKISLG
jgi:hypothetical protein